MCWTKLQRGDYSKSQETLLYQGQEIKINEGNIME